MAVKHINLFLICCSLIILIVFIASALLVLMLGFGLGASSEEYLFCSESPGGDAKLEIYRINSGATVDYTIRVYLVTQSKRDMIYNAYHEKNAEIQWITNNVVMINGIELDIEKGEVYDWRK